MNEPTIEDVNKGKARWTTCKCGHLAQEHTKEGKCEECAPNTERSRLLCQHTCEGYSGKIIWIKH